MDHLLDTFYCVQSETLIHGSKAKVTANVTKMCAQYDEVTRDGSELLVALAFLSFIVE